MNSSLALGLFCAAFAVSPEDSGGRTNAVLATLSDETPVMSEAGLTDPAWYYVAQAPGNGNGSAQPNFDASAANNGARRTASANPYARLARVPNMFGDSLAPAGVFFIDTADTFKPTITNAPPPTNRVATTLPLASGGAYIPIGENNKPLPVDRVFFMFNGFNNAITSTNVDTLTQTDSNIYRYTFGLEKTFFNKWSSIEVRLPLTNQFLIDNDGLNFSSGNLGNLSLVFKQVLYQNNDWVFATGAGLGLPTGSALKGVAANVERYQLGNNATYVIPYLGAAYAGDDNWFAMAYAQLAVAASGDQFQVNGNRIGTLNAPTFARFDLSTGYWLLRDVQRPYLSGLALVGEMHYVTSLTDGDVIREANGTIYNFGYTGNRYDFLNTTLGLHWQITDLSNFRIGGAFPVNSGERRQFDSELQLSFNRMF